MNLPWLDVLWSMAGLTHRDEQILFRRLTVTLDEIGLELGISRERVRQIQKAASKKLRSTCELVAEEELNAIDEVLAGQAAVADSDVSRLLATDWPRRREVMLAILGITRPQTWAGSLEGWWTRQPSALASGLKRLAADAPFQDAEVETRAGAAGLPDGLPLAEMLDSAGSPVVRHAAGPWWVRRTALQRDAAYLWLVEEGEPRDATQIASRLGAPEHATRESLRRDDRFAQLRPAGTWALAEWGPATGSGYRSALEAVIAILRARGSLMFDELVREMQDIYPVTTWRITQCLSSELIGRMHDHRIGLVADGASLVEEDAPARPENIAISDDGLLIALKMIVDHDLLRGSGLPAPRYLGWCLGLRHAPQSRCFKVPGTSETVTVKKNTSIVQISALRSLVVPLHVVKGCEIAVLLRVDEDTARVVHGCHQSRCPSTASAI